MRRTQFGTSTVPLSAFFGREQSTDARRANILRPGPPTRGLELRQVDETDADSGHDGNASGVVAWMHFGVLPGESQTQVRAPSR